MNDEILTLSHATERDIDLLLVEELRCSHTFRERFISELSLLIGVALSHRDGRVTHSRRRMHSRREIDVLLEIDGNDGRYAILIENKLDTAEQPQQAESYRLEAMTLVTEGFCNALTVLVCPEAYAAKASGFAGKFDAVFTYERILTILKERAESECGELGRRLHYRAELVSQAILKGRRGYQAVPLAAVGNFTRAYVAMLDGLGITLPPGPSMLKDAPAESKTMIFAPSALPKWDFLPQTRLVHQLREGNANICLYGWGDHFSYLAGEMATALAGTPYRLVPTINKRTGGRAGLMIVADTPQVDNLADFDRQRGQIEAGMRVTAALAEWFSTKKMECEGWAARVAILSA
ncbi:PD-(D/E)XK nuclease family protein [Sphingomonas sp. 2R-10]|uniref:PD-(D/E)XK nuclease family protein n=1 Tax=Sphingomonas sp. 2R-10 TaxID=3045148 RepID=UPI000F790078|nr:PD-(D/E)XK nuclease family protein [Sphingomonas sp. 2R-10]MDJ0278809.1 PD-(D/E)XK nuclease family protein [Sphingomonas sp. 2R-10]